MPENEGGEKMKNFWKIVALANTILFAMLVIGLYAGNLSIKTDSWNEGIIGVEGSVSVDVQSMP